MAIQVRPSRWSGTFGPSRAVTGAVESRRMSQAVAVARTAPVVARSLPRITVAQSRMTPYLRAWIEVSDGMLRWQVTRALFGVLPIGMGDVEVPIASVRVVRVLRVGRPLWRLIVALAAGVLLVVVFRWISVPIVLIGVWLTMVSFRPHLEVETVAGARHRAAFCLDAQLDAEL